MLNVEFKHFSGDCHSGRPCYNGIISDMEFVTESRIDMTGCLEVLLAQLAQYQHSWDYLQPSDYSQITAVLIFSKTAYLLV